MPLPNSTDRPLDASAARLLNLLEDIINDVQILPSFEFSHPHHPSLALEPEIFNSLQQLSPQLQDRYLRWRLGDYLFSLYEAGSSKTLLESDAGSASLPIQDEPVQNMALGVHSAFYKQLQTQNTGQGYFDPGWLVLRQEPDGLFAVQKNGLTLHIDDGNLPLSAEPIAIGTEVAIRLPSNRLEQGCYVALSNVGPVDSIHAQVVNVYFNLQPTDLVSLMGALTTALNALNRPFTFKVPYDTEDCDRPDAWAAVYPVLQLLYLPLQRSFRPELPLFTKFLAPGLALAEQPIDVITPQESFSMHRFQAIAQGLLQSWRQNQDTAAARMSAVLQSLAEHHIDPNYPYLNLGSEDIYDLFVDRAEATLS
jgi:HopA1 effector protein family